MNYDELEKKYRAIKDCRDMELGIERARTGIVNRGIVYKILAETDYGTQMGGADRNIECPLTVEESVRVFQLVQDMLTERLQATQADLSF